MPDRYVDAKLSGNEKVSVPDYVPAPPAAENPGPQPVVNAVPQPAGGQAPLNQADHAPEPDPHAGRSEQLHRPPEPQISVILLTSCAKYAIFSIERGALQRAERKRGFDLT